MTPPRTLDEIEFGPSPADRLPLPRGRRHRHEWLAMVSTQETIYPGIPAAYQVCGCGLARADYEARQRRGRNNRSRGGRAELDVARTYGGEKVGPLGLPEDIRGKVYATQVKTHQGKPPIWLRSAPNIRFRSPSEGKYVWVCRDVLGSGWVAYAPSWWDDIFDALSEGRTRRLIERWLPAQGARHEDWVIMRRVDEPNDPDQFVGHYVAWTGNDWLDRYGRDA